MTNRTAVILAGGRGIRIGRNIKALLRMGNKTLIQIVLENIQPLVDQTIVVIGKDSSEETFRKILPRSVELLRDEGNGEGALVGLLTGFRKAKSEYSLALPCDSPFTSAKVIELLFTEAQNMDAAIPLWPNGFIEPLHAVYKTKNAREGSESALKKGDRIRDMIKLLRRVRYIPTEDIRKIDPELLTFYNINSHSDFEQATTIFSTNQSLAISRV